MSFSEGQRGHGYHLELFGVLKADNLRYFYAMTVALITQLVHSDVAADVLLGRTAVGRLSLWLWHELDAMAIAPLSFREGHLRYGSCHK